MIVDLDTTTQRKGSNEVTQAWATTNVVEADMLQEVAGRQRLAANKGVVERQAKQSLKHSMLQSKLVIEIQWQIKHPLEIQRQAKQPPKHLMLDSRLTSWDGSPLKVCGISHQGVPIRFS